MKYQQPYGTVDDTSYVNGNPSTGVQGSIPPGAAFEQPQREIVNVIDDAALLSPDNADLHQLAKSIQSMKLISKDDVGTVNAYAVTLTPAPTSYFKYMTIILQITNTNTGPSVINVNALGNKSIVLRDGSELIGSELLASSITCLIYDGTEFQLVWTSRVTGSKIGLTAPKTFYVNGTAGNDTTYDGTTATDTGSGHGPFATIQHAVDQMSKYDNNGFDFTISVADYTTGTGYGNVTLPRITGSGYCHIAGNIAAPANVLSRGFGGAGTNGTYWIRGFKIANSGGDAIFGDGSGTIIYISNVEVGACAGPGHFVFQRGATGLIAGTQQGVASPSIKISGSCPSHIVLQDGGNLALYPQPLVITGTPNFSTAFITAYRCATANIPNCYTSITGSATGKRFSILSNAVVDTATTNTAYLPGDAAGTQASGGQYL